MRATTIITIISICLIGPVLARQPQQRYSTGPQQVRFTTLDIYVDSGRQPLAAYQFELQAFAGEVEIVGVEGGSHPAYSEPPYYDPAAMMNNHIIIAAFNTGRDLPRGRTRIATLHLQVTGNIEPQYEVELPVAADVDGNEIFAEVSLEKGE